jgi:hypothetical protein
LNISFVGGPQSIIDGTRITFTVHGTGLFRVSVCVGASDLVPPPPARLYNPTVGFMDGPLWVAGVPGETEVSVDIFDLVPGMRYSFTARVMRSSALHELARCAEDEPQADM